MDETWDEMLKASACTDDACEEGELVTAESWVARAAALALFARDAGAGSDAAMSRYFRTIFSRSVGRGGDQLVGRLGRGLDWSCIGLVFDTGVPECEVGRSKWLALPRSRRYLPA